MKRHPLALRSALLSALALTFTGCATTPRPELPETTPEGLVRVHHTRADIIYARPGVDLSSYNEIMLFEPTIAFRDHWQSDINSNRTLRRVSDSDVAKMIEEGKQLLVEEFGYELKKGGYTLVDHPGPRVLAVKAAILELDVFAPDPSNMADLWSRTYSNGSGEATLQLQLFDSVTGQVLLVALDRKSNENDNFTWRIPRTQMTNRQDARAALNDWARTLVNGLQQTRPLAESAAP